MDKIAQIQEALRVGQINPHLAAEYRAQLAGEYSFQCGLLEDILTRKAAIWNDMRPRHKSDTACEREYQQTGDGRDEQVIKLRLKSYGVMMSALTTLIKIAEGEVKNQY